MKQFNRLTQIERTADRIKTQSPRSWIQAIVKQAKLGRLKKQTETIKQKREWNDDDYHPHEH